MSSVSVVLPYYNRQDTLAAAAHSVLSQTHRDLVLIMVNDGSTDGSRAVAHHIKDTRVVHVDADLNSGPSAARNLGLSEASSHLVAFMDSDDEWLPTKLERQLAQLHRWHQVGLNVSVVGCGWQYVGSVNAKDFFPGPFGFGDMLQGVAGTGTPMLLVDRSRATSDVTFDVRLPALVERDYVLSCLRNGSLLGVVPEALALVTRGRSDHVADPARAARAWEFYLSKYCKELTDDPDLRSWYFFRASREYLVAGDRTNALRLAKAALTRKPLARGLHLLLGGVAGSKGLAVAQRLRIKA